MGDLSWIPQVLMVFGLVGLGAVACYLVWWDPPKAPRSPSGPQCQSDIKPVIDWDEPSCLAVSLERDPACDNGDGLHREATVVSCVSKGAEDGVYDAVFFVTRGVHKMLEAEFKEVLRSRKLKRACGAREECSCQQKS